MLSPARGGSSEIPPLVVSHLWDFEDGSIVERALPQERSVELSERVLARLQQTEKNETDPHFQSDIRIAWITALEASRDNPQPHVDATYRVLGLHPDKVWPSIVARRKAQLGSEYSLWYDADDNPRPESLGSALSESKCADSQVGQATPVSQGSLEPSDLTGRVSRSHNVEAALPKSSPKKPCASTKHERRAA